MDLFLATGRITQQSLFLNGLHQNSLTLYTLFEHLGYRCHCLTDTSEAFLEGYRSLEPETYVQNPAAYRLAWYIEIGHAFDAEWRAFLRRTGVRIVKLHLGNIRHIDVEMTCYMPEVPFYQHVIGNYDEIWTSPHYLANCAYAAALYRTPCRTVPYVWSNQWLCASRYVPCPWFKTDIVVAEPNISFQKHCLYPLLLVEAFAYQYPDWKGRLILQNTERFQINGFMKKRLAASPLKDRLVLRGREPLASILTINPSAAFVSHQVNNEYNYMTLELLHLGYPILHNSKAWHRVGFFWDEERWAEALICLRAMLGSPSKKYDLSAFSADANRSAWHTILYQVSSSSSSNPRLP
jgi:hypothetical protein